MRGGTNGGGPADGVKKAILVRNIIPPQPGFRFITKIHLIVLRLLYSLRMTLPPRGQRKLKLQPLLSKPLQISQLDGVGSHVGSGLFSPPPTPRLFNSKTRPFRGESRNPAALSPSFIRFRGASLSCQVPLYPSPPLNGGKGYKVSPQRPIQSTVYSGNLTPACSIGPCI